MINSTAKNHIHFKRFLNKKSIDRKSSIDYLANLSSLEVNDVESITQSSGCRLSRDFLDVLEQDNLEALFDLSKTTKSPLIERWIVQEIDRNGVIKLKSPFSGKILESSHSIGLNIFYFKEHGQIILLSFISRISYGFTECQITIPSLGLVIRKVLTTEDLCEPAQTAEIYIRLGTLLFDYISNRKAFRRYIQSPVSRYFLANTDHQHIGHSLWNGLSGWSNFLNVGLDRFEKLMSSAAYHINPTLLKADWKIRFVERSYKPLSAISASHFVFYLKSRYISADIADLVKSSATGSVDRNYPNRTVIMNLRLGNREQVNCKDFYYNIISSVLSRDNDVHFYVDGMNTDDSRQQTHTHQAIELKKEIELAEFLVNSFPHNVVSLVGCNVSENISAIANARIAVAPWGAGLAKLSWVCNVPTIVLSSLTVRDKKDDFNIYEDPTCRENAIGHILVSKEFITDLPQENTTNDVFKLNFLVDSKAVTECVNAILTYTSQ